MYRDRLPAQITAYGDGTQSSIYGIQWGTTIGAATVFRWRWNVIKCLYALLYLGQENQGLKGGTTREYRWLGFGLVGAVAWLSTPCRGTHQRFAPGRGNHVHLI